MNTLYGEQQRLQPGVPPWKLFGVRALDAATAQVVNRFHAVSSKLADLMAPRLRVRRDRIDVVPRGRDRQPSGRAQPSGERGHGRASDSGRTAAFYWPWPVTSTTRASTCCSERFPGWSPQHRRRDSQSEGGRGSRPRPSASSRTSCK